MPPDTSEGRPNQPDDAQRRAVDTRCSVWVAASAGTGKTTVLTNRVLNLLLGGTAPERILCLTFTKAAAAEMQNRLHKRLANWAVATDNALREDIAKISGPDERYPDADLLAQARRLFARVLEIPGGLRILTVHAFCQSILRRFPLEAEIPAQFEVLDDRSAAELLTAVQNQVLSDVGNDKPLQQAIAEITRHVEENGFGGLIADLIAERGRLSRALSEAGSPERYLDRIARVLGVRPDDTEARCIEAACRSDAFDELNLLGAVKAMLASSTATDQKYGNILAAWLAAAPAERARDFNDYCGVYLTLDGGPRKRIATKAVAAGWQDVLANECARILEIRAKRAAALALTATGAITHLGAAFLDVYATEKRRRGVLDYDDLILAVRTLLERPGISPWVLFKLDGGIEHVLIDEAQDTNPDQWQVAAALTAEFFAGSGASSVARTVFAVGDLKQSIFSFQRADPQHFLAMRDHFASAALAMDARLWRDVPLRKSFRSTAAVLDVVDAVFALPEAADGVAMDGISIVHEPHRTGEAGRVELWPPLDPPAEPEPVAWRLPLAAAAPPEPRLELAQLIARTIAYWLRSGETLVAKGRPVHAGDIMVLVRRRGGFVVELVRELKRLNVPIAGADRIVLTEQIAVMDLIALGQFLLMPEDDLTLATVLKCPLLGLDEDQLFAVAYERQASLWQTLRQHPAPWAEAAAASLLALLARADFVPPYELYAELLGAGGGRRKLLGRLGMEAAEAIDEFLAQALTYERTHVPSLQGFLHWIATGGTELKRDLDQSGRDEVRIMTVHGSKGLEAPIVFLPDTLAVPTKLSALLWLDDRTMLWAPGLAAAEPHAAAAKEAAKTRQQQEYRRLLYVALTRAEDRLIVCGWNTKRQASPACWYNLIEAGMRQVPGVREISLPTVPGSRAFDRTALVHETRQTKPLQDKLAALSLDGEPPRTLPGFVTRMPPSEPAPPRPLTASQPEGDEPPVRSPLEAIRDPQRFQCGLIMHRLLQSLPGLPPSDAEIAARRFLARQSPALEPEFQDEIAREVMAVVSHPEFAPLFGPQSRAEVPVVGLIDDRVLSARVDRLVATEREVLIVDYKTNRPPPRDADQVPALYQDQMSLYRRALQQIYPGRHVRTLLLWTDGPRLMEIGGCSPP